MARSSLCGCRPLATAWRIGSQGGTLLGHQWEAILPRYLPGPVLLCRLLQEVFPGLPGSWGPSHALGPAWLGDHHLCLGGFLHWTTSSWRPGQCVEPGSVSRAGSAHNLGVGGLTEERGRGPRKGEGRRGGRKEGVLPHCPRRTPSVIMATVSWAGGAPGVPFCGCFCTQTHSGEGSGEQDVIPRRGRNGLFPGGEKTCSPLVSPPILRSRAGPLRRLAVRALACCALWKPTLQPGRGPPGGTPRPRQENSQDHPSLWPLCWPGPLQGMRPPPVPQPLPQGQQGGRPETSGVIDQGKWRERTFPDMWEAATG